MSFSNLLGMLSGNGEADNTEKLLFNNVIGFRGIVDGVGCSTIVQGLANAFSDRTRKKVCVVDTHILYPAQYSLLCGGISSDATSMIDWLSLEVELPKRIIDTKFKRVSLLGCYNRRITDAFSTADSMALVDTTFDKLKELFDVILVDLSHEFTQISAGSALKCNKIFTVVDPSAYCVTNITQSLNNLATSAVPFSKFKNVIVNKSTPKGVNGLGLALSRNNLDTVATIPFSKDIYQCGVSGRSIWGNASASYGIGEFNSAIDALLCSIVNETPLEIIDMQEYAALEEAVANSSIKNKDKARVVELRKRNPILSPTTPEEQAQIRSERYAALRSRNVAIPEDEETDATEEIVGTAIENIVDDSIREDTKGVDD